VGGEAGRGGISGVEAVVRANNGVDLDRGRAN